MTKKDEFHFLARRNRLEAIVAEHHKRKAETGEHTPIPPVDEVPDESLSTPGTVCYKLRSLNAVRHGLTGQTVVMPWEDRQEYDKFCEAFLADLKPVGFEQTQLAQTIADCQWRLNRASAYESAIFFYESYLAYQGLHEEEVEMEMSKARVAMTVEKHLLNIALYESRIQRKMMNARKALKELQKEQSEPRDVGQDGILRADWQSAPSSLTIPSGAPGGLSDPRPEGAVHAATADFVPSRAEGPVDFVFSDLEAFCAPPPPAPLSAAQFTSRTGQPPRDFLAELANLAK